MDPSADGLPPTIPPPEWIENASCYTPELLYNRRFLERNVVDAVDAAKAFVIAVTTTVIIVTNLAFIVVINTRYYCKYLRAQPRYILSASVVNELCHASIVMSLGTYTALFECWPLGREMCQMQNSSLVLIVLATERYVSTMHPFSYNSICDKKICVFLLLLSFLVSGCFSFSSVVLNPMGFHFNVNGLMTCEPYYLSNNNALALAACLSYFPTTMTLMYCYGTIFHAARAKAKYRSVIFNTLPLLAGQAAAGGIDKFMVARRRNELASRSCAAISLTFIIVVTPWAILQAPAPLDFFVSWLAASHGFSLPLIYWMFNPKFREALQRFFVRKILRRPHAPSWSFYREGGHVEDESSNQGEDGSGGCRGQTSINDGGCVGGSVDDDNVEDPRESVREEHWGKILERSFSAHNLAGRGRGGTSWTSSSISSPSCSRQRSDDRYQS